MSGGWARIVEGAEVDFSGETWKHPDHGISIAFGSVSLPGGYPSAFDAATVEVIRSAFAADLSSGAMRWPTGVAYATSLGRLSTWLFGTGLSGPGCTFNLSRLDERLAESYFGYAAFRLGVSKSQSDMCRYAVQWAYDHAVKARTPGCTELMNIRLTRFKPRHLKPPPPSGEVPTPLLPAQADLPPVPTEFLCEGRPVGVADLLLTKEGTKPSIGLQRIVRPAGRPSPLTPRAQQIALLYVVREIESNGWTRHQILNAVDYFACWLGHHSEWREQAESFDWSDLTPDLAVEYQADIEDDSKGNDWWGHLRALYRWGVAEGLPDFVPDILQRLNVVGRAALLHVDTRSRFEPVPHLPAIPAAFLTRHGDYRVETAGLRWQGLHADGRAIGGALNLAHLDDPSGDPERSLFSLEFLHCVRLFLVHQGDRKWAWGTLEFFVAELTALQTWLADRGKVRRGAFGAESLTFVLLSNYRAHLEGFSGPGYSGRLSLLRVFYRWGVEQRLPGFSSDQLDRIEELRFRNAPRGELIRATDPEQGAFSMTEQRVLRGLLDDVEWGTPEERALVMLCWLLGPRPIQIARLRWKHFAKYATHAGVSYLLAIPRVKKRVPDDTTISRSLGAEPGLGPLLESLHPLDADPEDFLFPSLSRYQDPTRQVGVLLNQWASAGGVDRPLRTARLRNEAGEAKPMPINAYRFRRTMATNMARQRASTGHIAEMLDDDDERMALTYVENIEQIVKVLGDTLDMGEYFEIVGGWLGPTEGEGDQHLPEVRGRTLPIAGQLDEDSADLGGVGRCGAGALCDLEWPLSCYPCPVFKYREGGPHTQMLARAERSLSQYKAERNDRMAEIFQRICEKIAITVEAERRRILGLVPIVEVVS